jgi:hypothetical protein
MPALQHYVHALEIARYRLAIHQEQVAKGLKILKKALAETPK